MSTAFKSADILLPKNADMSKWAVVACDQYTSEPEYWADVEKITEGAKSALNLILPEVYLEDDNVDERIADIHKNMDSYISEGVFEEYKDAMIYVERTQSDGKVRAGIVGAIDLEEYDYRKGSKSAVRATEATVVERIPPRIKVRRGAPVELPHIMILVDDTEKSVVEPLEAHKGEMKKLYDFDLMKKGGHIAGYLVDKPMQEKIIAALEKLGDIDAFNTKYGLKETSPLVYAMGDGNHSLATAKEFYEEQKRENPDKDMSNALCRYALVEIVNLHSPALVPTLIEKGYVYIAESPLFEITTSDKTYFAYDENEKTKILKMIGNKKFDIQRSKGLGENEAEMMSLTTMDPATRRLIKIEPDDIEQTQWMFDMLLGDDLQGRKDFITNNGVDYLDMADIS